MGGVAVDARVRPYACLRFERTRIMLVFGREGVFWAFIRAWRFVPLPEIRTARRRGDVDAGVDDGADADAGAGSALALGSSCIAETQY